MSLLKLYTGDIGENGSDGIDGLTPSDVDDTSLSNPICSILKNNKLSDNSLVTYDRQGIASYKDRYNKNVWAEKETNTNYCHYSYDFSQWTDIFGRWSYIGTTADPFGNIRASEINLDVDTDALTLPGIVTEITINDATVDDMYMFSCYVKVISGEVSGLDFILGARQYTLQAPTSEWTRVSCPIPAAGIQVLAINPRGKTGARIGISGVQLQDGNLLTDYIETNGSIESVSGPEDKSKQSGDGYFIEGSKANLIHNSNDLSAWTKVNSVVSSHSSVDPFDNLYQKIKVSFQTIATITIEATTEAITESNTYYVSFYARVFAGSLNSARVSLGNGSYTTLDQLPTSGFSRIQLPMVAGPDNTLTVELTSANQTGQVLLSCFQIEEDETTSFILTGPTTQSRTGDFINFLSYYNAPKPSQPWSIAYRVKNLANTSTIKTLFSNGETGANEFSLKYQNRLLTLNNGGDTSSIDAYDYSTIAITYNGTTALFYGGGALISTDTVSNTTTLSTTTYVGYNGTDEHLNAYLSNFKFYNKVLSANDIIYLLGE